MDAVRMALMRFYNSMEWNQIQFEPTWPQMWNDSKQGSFSCGTSNIRYSSVAVQNVSSLRPLRKPSLWWIVPLLLYSIPDQRDPVLTAALPALKVASEELNTGGIFKEPTSTSSFQHSALPIHNFQILQMWVCWGLWIDLISNAWARKLGVNINAQPEDWWPGSEDLTELGSSLRHTHASPIPA